MGPQKNVKKKRKMMFSGVSYELSGVSYELSGVSYTYLVTEGIRSEL
jgi:hypothetical protein